MVTAEPCAMSDLPPEMCSHCRGLDKRPIRDLPPASHTMSARHGGRCPECDRSIREGDLIGIVEGEWLCSGCWL